MKNTFAALCLLSLLGTSAFADTAPFAKAQIQFGEAYENVWVEVSVNITTISNPAPSINSGGNYQTVVSAGSISGNVVVSLENSNNYGVGFLFDETLTADVKASPSGTSTATISHGGQTATMTKSNGAKDTDLKYPQLTVSLYANQTATYTGSFSASMSY